MITLSCAAPLSWNTSDDRVCCGVQILGYLGIDVGDEVLRGVTKLPLADQSTREGRSPDLRATAWRRMHPKGPSPQTALASKGLESPQWSKGRQVSERSSQEPMSALECRSAAHCDDAFLCT